MNNEFDTREMLFRVWKIQNKHSLSGYNKHALDLFFRMQQHIDNYVSNSVVENFVIVVRCMMLFSKELHDMYGISVFHESILGLVDHFEKMPLTLRQAGDEELCD